jgi:hypothetical protein
MFFRCAICDSENESGDICNVCGSERDEQPPRNHHWLVIVGVVLGLAGIAMFIQHYPLGSIVHFKGRKSISRIEDLWLSGILSFIGLSIAMVGLYLPRKRKRK